MVAVVAPQDELIELQGWMWRVRIGENEFHVSRNEEAEAEKGDDDEVDEADGDGRNGSWRVEGAEIED